MSGTKELVTDAATKSDASSSIKTELTKEEWENGKLYLYLGEAFEDPEGDIGFVGDEGRGIALVLSTERRALAALCLHNQPFGFTWDDVKALRAHTEYDHCTTNHDSLFTSLADRIEAFLPPKDTP